MILYPTINLLVGKNIERFFEQNKYPNMPLYGMVGGLWYQDSKILGETIYRKYKDGPQIIIGTHDVFIMDKIPIDYWHCLTPEGEEIDDEVTSKEGREEFQMVGLNNWCYLFEVYGIRTTLE